MLPARALSQKEALHYFDQLEPVHPEEMVGRWKGTEYKTGHPMDGLLSQLDWYGKEFLAGGHAHPLIFQKKDGTLFNLNPDFLPAGFPLVRFPGMIVRPLFALFQPFLSTKKTKARLRMIEWNGKASSAMIYDRLAIIDHFRKIDEHTLLGLMDYKGKPEQKKYFFLLKREQGTKNEKNKGVVNVD